jgi:hypothetical integral membrane protein (TIGR02206 family)
MFMFFKTQDSIPQGLGFKAFDLTHLLWLFVIILACISACFIYKKLSQNRQNVMLKTLGIVIISQEMLKNVIVAAIGEFEVGYLPFHLCGINILLIAFDIFKPTKIVRAFLYFFCIPGAMLALLFPNWTEVPFLNFFHLHSFIIHGLLVMYPLLLITSGQLKLKFSDMPKSIGLLILMAIPIYFLNLLWDTNFMFLMQPDKGNPLEMFEKLLGNHLWGFPILLPIVVGLMYLPVLIVNKVKKSNNEINNTKTDTVKTI